MDKDFNSNFAHNKKVKEKKKIFSGHNIVTREFCVIPQKSHEMCAFCAVTVFFLQIIFVEALWFSSSNSVKNFILPHKFGHTFKAVERVKLG